MNAELSRVVARTMAQAVVIYRQFHKAGQVCTALAGSGVVYNQEGVIVTNEHVLRRGGSFVVETASGRRYPAENVSRNIISDVAVLRIEPEEELTAATFAEAMPEVGDMVFAIGNPITHRYKNTVTFGYVSHQKRFDPDSHIQCMPLLQSNVLTGSGNSGGGLFNERGHLVGLNTLYFDLSDALCSGYSFSVSARDVRWVVEQILQTGRGPGRYDFGADINPVGPAIAEAYGLDRAFGVMVEDVDEKSFAAACGLQVGDILHAIGEVNDISCPNALDYALMRAEGAEVEVQVVRAGDPVTLTLSLPPRRRRKRAVRGRKSPYTPFGLKLGNREQGTGVAIEAVAPGSHAAIEGFVGGCEVVLALQHPETLDWTITQDFETYQKLASRWPGRCVAAKVATPEGPNIKGIRL